MARLILKFPYLKGGSGKTAAHLSNLVKYIATRDGVEKVKSEHEHWRATKKQQELIAQIIREFPSTKESLEFEDYLAESNRKNASEFITIALEQNLDKLGDREKYLDYIANRPRVEKVDTHGLFTSSDEPLVLEQVAREVSAHQGNVWTPIISLRREDAETFGYESAFAWKALLSSKAMEIAANLKIHPDHLKWYAAFHNESHHPHVHMICYSTNPTEGYLTTNGIKKTKSALATEIFKSELIPLYGQKTQRRDTLKEQAALTMRDMVVQMQNGTLHSEKMEQLMTYLADRLQYTTGKKQYGYLKPSLKNVVDEMVNELARDERVAAAYHAWQETKGLIDALYSDKPPENLPLSKCEEFKPIRNMVIKEALYIKDGMITFEEPKATDNALPDIEIEEETSPEVFMADDTNEIPLLNVPEEEICSSHSPQFRNSSPVHRQNNSWWTAEYKLAKQYLFGDGSAGIAQDFDKARNLFLTEAEKENPLAMYDLGRMCADGLGAEPDAEEAHHWYEEALAGFHRAEEKKPWKYTEYRIGKMYAAGLGTEHEVNCPEGAREGGLGRDYEKAVHWLTLSANEGYKYAEYSLGGLYYRGDGVEQSYETAFDLYTRSAAQDFPYASYELGKMLRDGIGCIKNSSQSDRRFRDAFVGFTALEQKSKDDKLQYRLGWMLLNGVGTDKDVEKAKSYLDKSAAVGNLFACYSLAKLILTDEAATPQEVEKALKYMHQAVDAENPHAEYFLGKLYEKGQHVPQNTAEAMRLYKLSAEHKVNCPEGAREGGLGRDNDYAAYRLGKLYLGGEGVLKNIEDALRWLHFAAEKKNQFAEYALGVLYLKDEEVPKDAAKAIAFFNRAAVQGNQFAQYRLGKIYLSGEDVPKDVESAIRYLTGSADQSNQFAQYAIGKLYLMGKDVPRDKETAMKWFTLSAAQGNIYAQFFLDHMDSFRDPSVMLAATRLLHHAGRVFADNTPQARSPVGHQVDRKLQRKIREKKMAQGHARDDHEQSMHTQY